MVTVTDNLETGDQEEVQAKRRQDLRQSQGCGQDRYRVPNLVSKGTDQPLEMQTGLQINIFQGLGGGGPQLSFSEWYVTLHPTLCSFIETEPQIIKVQPLK